MNANEYKVWIQNPDNVRNCEECPHNIDCGSSLPCGQQHCWVSIHTEEGLRD